VPPRSRGVTAKLQPVTSSSKSVAPTGSALHAALVCHQPGANFALDFATTLRELAPELPIILAAPSARDLDAPLLAASGISEVVHHPLTSAELAGVLSRCLAANAARQLH
jgi:CheY-like chemotaxis protein